MLEAILRGAALGIVVTIILLLLVMFIVHRFKFKDYPITIVYCIQDKNTPFWYLVALVVGLCILFSMMSWGIESGGVARAAVLWGIAMHFVTFTAYRVLWAFIETGFNFKQWFSVWDKTKVHGSMARKADQKICLAIMVASAVLTSWLAVSGVYG